KIAVDEMGPDYGPQELVLGAVQALRAYDSEVVLVGDTEIIKKLLEEYNAADERKITVHQSSEVINKDEHPGIAVK
ncbi:phosphate acyltransferase, partial [Phascolarctobacterium faecium]|nr:phosphate acyltransferase [Phascolarctobacterium faecium]